MIPKLYSKVSNIASSFICNINNCSYCRSTETLNGDKILELKTDVNDAAAEMLCSGLTIMAKANNYQEPQFYTITETIRKTDGSIEISCNHIKNLAYSTILDSQEFSNEYTPTEIFEMLNIKLPYSMKFESNIVNKKRPNAIDHCTKFGDFLSNDNGLVRLFNAELEFDNKTIYFKDKIGTISNYKLKYGSNISSAQQVESAENLYSHVLPYGKVNYINSISKESKKKIITTTDEVEIPDSVCVYHRTIPVSCDLISQNYTVYSNGAGYAEVREAMKTFALGVAKAHGYNNRKVSISIDFDSALDDMQALRLGDTVTVVLNKFGTTATARISNYEYDCLLERYTKFDIGTPIVTLADILTRR